MRRRDFILIQLLLWAVIVLLALGPAHAATATPPSSQIQNVQVLEDTLYTFRYDQEPLETRIKRLEETVFGEAQTNRSLDERISKLKSALSPGTLGPLSHTARQAATQPKTPAASANTGKPTVQAPGAQPTAARQAATPPPAQQGAPLQGETDYPTVSHMELKLFGQTFEKEDVTQRLVRLEQRVFQTVQTGALVDRVDNLRIMVLGESTPPATMATAAPSQGGGRYVQVPNQPYQTGPAYTQFPSNKPYQPNPYPQQPVPNYQTQTAYQSPVSYDGFTQPQASSGSPATPDMLAAMTEIEKQVLGPTYPSEPFNTRLDRVEMKVFGSTSPEMSNDDRIQRILAVAAAGGAPESPKARAKSTFQNLLPIIITILPLLLL